jgi:hypothetical protein
VVMLERVPDRRLVGRRFFPSARLRLTAGTAGPIRHLRLWSAAARHRPAVDGRATPVSASEAVRIRPYAAEDVREYADTSGQDAPE